jgi:Fe-S oxidoreductase
MRRCPVSTARHSGIGTGEVAVADKVIYFTGCFANYYQPDTGKALVAVMEKNGIEVIVPEQKCCGMPMMANGNRQGAKRNFDFIAQSLARAAAPGYDVVTTCPSCTMMLRKDGPAFFDSADARFIAAHVYDAGQYLLTLRQQGRLNLDFGRMPLRVFYHNPCHLKVQNITATAPALLQLIPGLQLAGTNTSCCGMGGSYGLKTTNYERSRDIAGKVWSEVKSTGADVVATECGGCGLQIEAGTGMKILHPLVILQRAHNAFNDSTT